MGNLHNLDTECDGNSSCADPGGTAARVRVPHCDPLTGYLNYEGYKRQAEALLDQNPDRRYSVWYCDIKRFKYINGVYGYETGDCLLRYWADLLNADTREGECFCRVSADIMACLRRYEDVGELEDRFSDLASKLADFSGRIDSRYVAELVCGIYLVNKDSLALGIHQMLDRANIAQKSVKGRSGSMLAFFTDEMWGKQLWELEITQHMRVGIQNGEFSVWFQPQYNYSTGMIVGAEALVRWRHPALGNVPPGEFIPVLEKCGLISELDEYVWDQTLRYMRRWLDDEDKLFPVSVAVNISRLDIYNPRLCDTLLSLVEKYRLSPSAVKLEITESAYVENPEKLIQVVHQLRNHGFSIEMDDFGSGYSSLNILQDVPVDMIKLDMRFLSREVMSDKSGIILSSIVRMAHWLRLPIIAEGVETKAQADYLISIGCDLMQGYYFSKPMPVDEFEKLISSAKIDCSKKQHHNHGDLLNVGSFLDPGGSTPLIFSHCIGPAAVYEYVGGNMEALFVNDQYYHALGISREEFEPWRTRVLERYSEPDRQILLSAIEKAIWEGYAVCRLRVIGSSDPLRQWWLRVQMRRLSASGSRHILFLLFDGHPEPGRPGQVDQSV